MFFKQKENGTHFLGLLGEFKRGKTLMLGGIGGRRRRG